MSIEGAVSLQLETLKGVPSTAPFHEKTRALCRHSDWNGDAASSSAVQWKMGRGRKIVEQALESACRLEHGAKAFSRHRRDDAVPSARTSLQS